MRYPIEKLPQDELSSQSLIRESHAREHGQNRTGNIAYPAPHNPFGQTSGSVPVQFSARGQSALIVQRQPTFSSGGQVIQRALDITNGPAGVPFDVPLPGANMPQEVKDVVYRNQPDTEAEAQKRYRASPDDVQQVLHGLSLIDWRGSAEYLRQRVLQDAAAARFFRSGEKPLEAVNGGVNNLPRVTRLYRSMTEPEFLQLRQIIEAAEDGDVPDGQARVRGKNNLILDDPDEERRLHQDQKELKEAHPTAPTGHFGGISQAHHHFGVGAGHHYLVEFKLSWPAGGNNKVLLGGAMDADHVYPQNGGGPNSALGRVRASRRVRRVRRVRGVRGVRGGYAKAGEGYPNLHPGQHTAVGLKAENTAGERLSVATASYPSTHGLERMRHLAPRLDVQLIAAN